MEFEQANIKFDSMYGVEYKRKVKGKTHDLDHDLTFYFTHSQLCVPKYKVNVQST